MSPGCNVIFIPFNTYDCHNLSTPVKEKRREKWSKHTIINAFYKIFFLIFSVKVFTLLDYVTQSTL